MGARMQVSKLDITTLARAHDGTWSMRRRCDPCTPTRGRTPPILPTSGQRKCEVNDPENSARPGLKTYETVVFDLDGPIRTLVAAVSPSA
jgi:hypothetical protein